jgi:hypothetical protein
MHNETWKDKAPENIPVVCKIRHTVNRVVLLDIKYYMEVIVHTPVIGVAW